MEAEHGGIGMRGLDQDDIVKVDAEAEGMEVEAADGRRVALEAGVHLPLGLAPQGLVNEKRQGQCEEHQRRNDTDQPFPTRTHR